MRPPKRSALQRLATAAGIQTSYIDNTGITRTASEETLTAVLKALEIDPNNPENVLESLISKKRERLCEPVIVCWQRKFSPPKLKLNLAGRKSKILLRSEDGSETELSAFKKNSFQLPRLATGYHKLFIEQGNQRAEALLISAPPELFSPRDDIFQWGIFLPLYAIRTKNSWGAGNFSDWKQLGRWAASKGAGVIGTLPILSAFLDYPTVEPSPYSPASRLFWNEFFVDITAIPEFNISKAARKLASSPAFQGKLKRFRAEEYVNYSEEWAIRRKVLEILAREFLKTDSARHHAFKDYLEARPEVTDYAAFRATCDQAKTSWHKWPHSEKSGKLSAGSYSKDVRDFYLYIQWIAQSQMDDLLNSFRSDDLRFYLDLPLGVNPDGYDSWRYREFFALGASVGAPPDSFFTKGQDWGFAPPHPEKLRQQHYKYVIDYLRFQMRHTGMLRIDHVMGLHRLYWVPRGLPASAGAYVRYNPEDLYAILSVESHRHKTMLVGENLGTVPPGVNETMDRHGVRRMYVLQYEQRPKGPLPEPHHHEVASLNTHDMPTFAAHWAGDDIADRADLGLILTKDVPKFKKEREHLRQNLISILKAGKLLKGVKPKTLDVLAATLEFLAQSPAETALVNLEDLWLEKRPQNTPGTSKERINWRRKSKLSLEQIVTHKQVCKILAMINSARSRQKPPAQLRRKR